MSTERPTFSLAKKVGYDAVTVDRAVDWVVSQRRQGALVSQADVDALQFEMVRRGGYEAVEVDDWLDSIVDGTPDGSSSDTATLPIDLRDGGMESPTGRRRRLQGQVILGLLVVGLLIALIAYFV